MESRIVELHGHLLDSGIISRALDLITENSGSFQVLDFKLGVQKHSTSSAKIKVSAPAPDLLATILRQLIEMGAVPADQTARCAQLAPVVQAGVAPDDFYVTTIYPTEVLINGTWVRCQNQRMDAVIVVATSATGEVTATCKLLRDLVVGEQVVVGVDGIRTAHKTEAREKPQEFSFMGSGVSSERRVELVVEQIAWELRQIRDRGGKVVVTAGPVVVHTGGAPHLAYLIEAGYVHALLGGNAIAVHDIEQAMMGTSLGVDLQRG